jgi:nucleotide-binding universal stress UspA family protein
MKLAKILLPVDFSERGLGSARYASGLAQHFASELTLLHVNELSVAGLSVPAGLRGLIGTDWVSGYEAHLRLELETYQRSEFQNVNLETVVVSGEPAKSIVEYAHSRKVDLIVMPTRGYGPFRRFLLGSVTAKVLSDADCPVWTGAHMEDNSNLHWKVMNHVLCAIDGGPSSERVLNWAWRFANEFNSRFTIVHAVADFEEQHDLTDPKWLEEPFANIKEQIRCLAAKTGCRGEVLVHKGNPRKVVADAAARLRADLLVVGRSRSEGASGRLRPNAYALISDSPCPVVSL